MWLRQSIQQQIRAASSGQLGEFNFFYQYLPKAVPVLEAGCGTGWIVAALSAQGYQVEGIDYAPITISKIRDVAPSLNVRVGDVFHIDVPDKTYGGYISLGVFEHHAEGPLQGLLEARRVLRDDGIALISVPYLNVNREKLLPKTRVENRTILDDGLSFYQYYFSREDFGSFLKMAGFTPIKTIPYGAYSGLTRDTFWGRWLIRKKFFFLRFRSIFLKICETMPNWAKLPVSHMMLYICAPTVGNLFQSGVAS